MFRQLRGEFRALARADIRGLAAASILWRLAYLPAIIWALPVLTVTVLAALIVTFAGFCEALTDFVKPFLGAPYRWVDRRRKAIYARAQEIRRARGTDA